MQIEEYRSRLEEFEEALNRELYLHYSGRKEQLETTSLYSNYSDLFSRETIRSLEVELEKVDTFFASRKRSLAKLRAFAEDQHLDQLCSPLSETIAEFESTKVVGWDGTDIFFTQIPVYLANEPVAGRRRQLNEIRARLLDESNALRMGRLKQLHDGVRMLGYKSYRAAYESNTGIDYSALASSLASLIEATEGDYMERLGSSFEANLGLPLPEARRCDVGFWCRMSRYDDHFARDCMLRAQADTLRGLALDLERQSAISLDLEEREHKHARAFCAPIRIPHEIKIVLLPRGGQDDYAALMHETGHAQHFAWTSPALPPEHRLLGDRGLAEAYAFLFENLLWNEQWLRTVAGFVNPGDFIRFKSLVRVYLIRRYCGKLNYEILLHGENGLQNSPDAYVESLEHSTGIRHEPQSYLEDLDDGFYSADYLRAWVFEAQLRDYLRVRFGNAWFQDKAAGKFFKEIWETGHLYRIDELTREIGLGIPDPQVLTDELCWGLRQ